jgi:hypothetical protein
MFGGWLHQPIKGPCSNRSFARQFVHQVGENVTHARGGRVFSALLYREKESGEVGSRHCPFGFLRWNSHQEMSRGRGTEMGETSDTCARAEATTVESAWWLSTLLARECGRHQSVFSHVALMHLAAGGRDDSGGGSCCNPHARGGAISHRSQTARSRWKDGQRRETQRGRRPQVRRCAYACRCCMYVDGARISRNSKGMGSGPRKGVCTG